MADNDAGRFSYAVGTTKSALKNSTFPPLDTEALLTIRYCDASIQASNAPVDPTTAPIL